MRALLFAPWLVFMIVWVLAAPFSRRTVRAESLASRLSYSLPFALVAVFIFSRMGTRFWPWLGVRLVPESLRWVGFGVECVGFAFAIWARAHLGRLWSASVTLKEGHHLVQSGPFALARHPIYTGILVGLLGIAIVVGRVAGVVVFALVVVSLVIKSSREERLLAEQFGAEHAQYRARVARLIPFIW